MTPNPETITSDDILSALDDAVALGWLLPIRQGYCFHCHRETLVYEILAEGSPVQPPRCPACFVDAATAVLHDPCALATLPPFTDDGPA